MVKRAYRLKLALGQPASVLSSPLAQFVVKVYLSGVKGDDSLFVRGIPVAGDRPTGNHYPVNPETSSCKSIQAIRLMHTLEYTVHLRIHTGFPCTHNTPYTQHTLRLPRQMLLTLDFPSQHTLHRTYNADIFYFGSYLYISGLYNKNVLHVCFFFFYKKREKREHNIHKNTQ